MGRLVLPHALLPAVKGLRCAPQPTEPTEPPTQAALQETEETPEENFHVTDVFQAAASYLKANIFFFFHVKQ